MGDDEGEGEEGDGGLEGRWVRPIKVGIGGRRTSVESWGGEGGGGETDARWLHFGDGWGGWSDWEIRGCWDYVS